LIAAVLGLWLVFGTVQQPAGFHWSVRDADASDVARLHINTGEPARVWLDEPLGSRITGRAGIGIEVTVRLEVTGPPLRSQVRVSLNGPGGSLGRSVYQWEFLLLGPLSSLGVFAGFFQPRFGALLTAAGVIAVAAGSGSGVGWSRSWRGGPPSALVKLGVVISGVAIVVSAIAAVGAVEGFGYDVMDLFSMEEYDTGIALSVFACAVGLLWLGVVFVGLGTAPRRVSPIEGTDVSRSTDRGARVEALAGPVRGEGSGWTTCVPSRSRGSRPCS
jgi:hypothetical protein